MKPLNVHGNLSMRQAIRIARELGCIVRAVNATDEIVFSHKDWNPPRLTMTSTRRDAGLKLVGRLRKLQKAQADKR